MRSNLRIIFAVLAAGACIAPAQASARAIDGFFGIAPQAVLTSEDTDRMARGGIEAVRVPVPWGLIQPAAGGEFNWGPVDDVVETAAKSGLPIFPFLYETPGWAGKATTLPVQTKGQQRAWVRFVRAAVGRYGRGGDYWEEHSPASADPVPHFPIREWQVWNEANFFYFATPASPTLYGKLLRISSRAIKSVDRKAKVILTGLFARPDKAYPKGLPAVKFLNRLYALPGIKEHFDGAALHPYAPDAKVLKAVTDEFRAVMIENEDRRTGLYITELGWGSEDNSPVSFERGTRGQVRELRGAYTYLIRNQRRLNIKRTFWFAWKDAPPDPPTCSFCDSVGLFASGADLVPKPAWFAFVDFTRGDPSAPPAPPSQPEPSPIPQPCTVPQIFCP